MDDKIIKSQLKLIGNHLRGQGITGAEHRRVMARVPEWLKPLDDKEMLKTLDHVDEMANIEFGLKVSPQHDRSRMNGVLRDLVDSAPPQSRPFVASIFAWGRRKEGD
jgi:hypothetical protein